MRIKELHTEIRHKGFLVSSAERILDTGFYFSGQVNGRIDRITAKHQDDFSPLFTRQERDSPNTAQVFSRRLLSPKVLV